MVQDVHTDGIPSLRDYGWPWRLPPCLEHVYLRLRNEASADQRREIGSLCAMLAELDAGGKNRDVRRVSKLCGVDGGLGEWVGAGDMNGASGGGILQKHGGGDAVFACSRWSRESRLISLPSFEVACREDKEHLQITQRRPKSSCG